MRTFPWVALPLVLAATALGCSETPADGFEAFFTAETHGKRDEALARLSASARKALADAHVDPTAARPRTTLRTVRELSREGDDAVLEVEDALGRKETVHMRHEEGLWRVDVGAL